MATGDSLGTKGGEMELGRTVLDPILARNPNLKVSTKVASNHAQILPRTPPPSPRPSASGSPPPAQSDAGRPALTTASGGARARLPDAHAGLLMHQRDGTRPQPRPTLISS